MCRMTVHTFLAWKFPEISHMESLLTCILWFRWDLFVKKCFLQKTQKSDLLWDLRPNRQRQNDRTLILLLWVFFAKNDFIHPLNLKIDFLISLWLIGRQSEKYPKNAQSTHFKLLTKKSHKSTPNIKKKLCKNEDIFAHYFDTRNFRLINTFLDDFNTF